MATSDALLVTQYYWPEPIGSAPFCVDLAEWIARHRQRVTVLTSFPHYPNREMYLGQPLEDRPPQSEGGVGVVRLRNWHPRRATALHRILSEAHFLALGGAAILIRQMARRPLVLSLSPSILSVALGALATRRGGRHVALVHDIQSGLAAGLGMVRSTRFLRLMQWVERRILDRTDLVIVLSREMRDHLRDIGVAAPIEIVPIWVDADRIRPMPPERRETLRVLYSGSLGRKQGLGQVVAAAAELQARAAPVEILLRGTGSEAEPLAQSIAEMGLGNIRIGELLPRESLSEGLAEGDIHLVPQDPEAADFAMPSKVFNIMAAARPFVATAREGTSLWRLAEESGAFLCVPPNEPRVFADAVQSLAGDAALRATLGARGRAFVEAHRCKSKVLMRFLSLIEGAHAAG
jgi:colanic acid biosynthesis glycosyl transferase WcaI